MLDIHPIEFKLSKNKLISMVAGIVPLVVGIGTIFQSPPEKLAALFPGSEYVMLGIACLGVIFIGVLAVAIFNKLRDNRPGLVVSDEGITDNSSGVSAGFIPWSDVLEIKPFSLFGGHSLRIIVKNPEEYIQRQSGAFKRWLMRRNYKSFGAAIAISSGSIRCSFEELEDLVNRRFKAYQEQNPNNKS
jgi:hypothetical protein